MAVDSSEFAGKGALVTGAGSGIGEACARLLTAKGARVLVADLVGERAERVATSLPGAVAFTGDVTDADSVEAMIASAVDAFGSLDIAVNNAGTASQELISIGDIAIEDWERVRSVLLDGVFLGMRAEIRQMLNQPEAGAIVNIASIYGAVGCAGQAAYTAAKHGVVGLTKVAALEYAAEGIRVNSVGPGYVRTPLLEANLNEEEKAAAAAAHPVGRLAETQEVAELVAWLSSDAAGFANGSFYPIDGGFLAQ